MRGRGKAEREFWDEGRALREENIGLTEELAINSKLLARQHDRNMESAIEIDALRTINAGLVEEGGSADQSIVALEKRIATLTAEIAQWKRVVVAHVEEIERLREALEDIRVMGSEYAKGTAINALKQTEPKHADEVPLVLPGFGKKGEL